MTISPFSLCNSAVIAGSAKVEMKGPRAWKAAILTQRLCKGRMRIIMMNMLMMIMTMMMMVMTMMMMVMRMKIVMVMMMMMMMLINKMRLMIMISMMTRLTMLKMTMTMKITMTVNKTLSSLLFSHLVFEKVDEEWTELRLPDCRAADARHRHEDVRAGLPHPPYSVLAEVEELWQLKIGTG